MTSINLKLTSRTVALIVVGATALMALVWYLSLYTPARDRAAVLREEIAALEDEKLVGERARRNIVALCAAVGELQVQKAAFLRALPRAEELSGLLGDLGANIAGNGGRLNTVARSRDGGAGLPAGVRSVNLNLGLEGPWLAVNGILRSVEALQRFTKVQTVSLSLPQAVESYNPSLGAQLAMTTYVYDAPSRDGADAVSPSCQAAPVATGETR